MKTICFRLGILFSLALLVLISSLESKGNIEKEKANGKGFNYKVEKWKVLEISLTSSKKYANPFSEVEVNATFSGPHGKIIIRPAFWDGDSTWKIRFAPTVTGKWKMVSSCSDVSNSGLNAVSLSIKCNSYSGNLDIYKHGFLKISDTNRYFVFDDGTPFFWLSEDHAFLNKESWDECNKPGCTSQFRYMADKRKAQGFTIYQNVLWTKSAWTPDGIPDLKIYHDYDRKYKYLADLGFVNAFALGYHTDLGDCTENPGEVEKMKQAAKYVEARYGAYPVIYETAGEFNIPCKESKGKLWDRFWWGKVAEVINSFNSYKHPCSIGYWQPQGTWFAEKPYLQWWALQAYSRRDAAYYSFWWNYNPPKPIIDTWSGMDHGNNETRSTERNIQYLIFQSGGAGCGILTEGIWNACWQKDSCGCCANQWGGKPWHETIDFSVADDMTHLKQFYTSFEWWKQVPRFDDTSWAEFTNQKQSLLTSNGKEIFVLYFYNRLLSTGTLKNMEKNVLYTAKWFNPINGSYTIIKPFKSGDGTWLIPDKPDSDDWILIVAKANSKISYLN